MIRKQVKTDDFTIEIKLELADPNLDFLYKDGIDTMAKVLEGAIRSGELFPYFLVEFKKFAQKMLVAVQTERALRGE